MIRVSIVSCFFFSRGSVMMFFEYRGYEKDIALRMIYLLGYICQELDLSSRCIQRLFHVIYNAKGIDKKGGCVRSANYLSSV